MVNVKEAKHAEAAAEGMNDDVLYNEATSVSLKFMT